MRVVAHVGHDHACVGEAAGPHVAREPAHRRVQRPAGTSFGGEVGPGVVPYGVLPRRGLEARRRHGVGVHAGGVALGQRLSEHRGSADRVGRGVVVVVDAERRAAGDGEVVRQRGMRHRSVVRGVAVVGGECVRPRHLGAHLVERVVLDHEHEELAHAGRGCGGRGRGRGRVHAMRMPARLVGGGTGSSPLSSSARRSARRSGCWSRRGRIRPGRAGARRQGPHAVAASCSPTLPGQYNARRRPWPSAGVSYVQGPHNDASPRSHRSNPPRSQA